MDALKEAFKDLDKKSIIIGTCVIVGVILLLVILNALSNATGNVKTTNYFDVEEKLVSAAKKYYKDNSDFLPLGLRSSGSVDLSTLVEEKYIKPLSKYMKNADSCDGRVVVTKLSESEYEYLPYLKCEDYETLELYKKILEDNKLTEDGIGLYSINNEKVFRGEVKNNYVSLNGNLWRVLRVDSNNNVVLISNFRTDIYIWDNRYNIDTTSSDGINDYNISRIREIIEGHYNDGSLLTKSEKTKVVPMKACVSFRIDSNGNVGECEEYTEDELYVRLLTVDEYLQVSLDSNCKSIEDRPCTNYNYLHDLQSSFWTITKGQKNTAYVYSISTGGVSESRANNNKQIRYVINLGTKTFYSSGSGTFEDPYIIR